MNGGRGWFNASAHLLFEESGDSEEECVDGSIGGACELESDGGGADDDAQSCNYESSPDCEKSRDVEADEDDLIASDLCCGGEFFSEGDDRKDDCVDNDDEDGVVDQCLGGRLPGAAPEALKVTNNETESDRLFWEACLAS